MASRAFFLIGVIAAAVVAFVVILAAVASGDRDGTAAVQAVSPTTPPTLAAPEPTATSEPEPTPLPDRTSCDEIRGTDYRSQAEHQFFVASCIPTPAPVPPTTTPLPQPAGPPAQPAATATAPPRRVITPTIDGVWHLQFDNGGAHKIEFDAQGRVLAFWPPQRAPRLSGSGSISGNTMTIDASGFVTDGGSSFSFTFTGTRLSDADFYKLVNLDPTIAALTRALGGVVFWGQLKRSDIATPYTVAAIKGIWR